MRTEPPEPTDLEFFELLTGSFLRLVGKPLLEQGQGPDWLYREVSTVILAHDTESPVKNSEAADLTEESKDLQIL
ncbi:hypothetical protein [Rhizobium grahamii]|uniref:hypothetical protein n=1 Tax=Rhizobium grahamii TaxID=1120045 RepID=UPI0026C521D6